MPIYLNYLVDISQLYLNPSTPRIGFIILPPITALNFLVNEVSAVFEQVLWLRRGRRGKRKERERKGVGVGEREG